MVWATPGNISTTNLDANTDSPSLARADIKTALDEFTKVANNTKVSWTPVVTLPAGGSHSISYDSRTANYIQMGDIVFFELAIQFDTTINDSTAFGSTVEITGFPANPSSAITPIEIAVQTSSAGTFQGVTALHIQASGNKAQLFSSASATTAGSSTDNAVIKAKGWYFA